ncbi:MAG: hypothetical protein IIC58_06120 [Proteobacteria bacterium]|nr:hypothetical protein [Pseudomonadota bacterium]
MLEIKAIYVVLLAEGFGVSILFIILMIGLRLRTRRRNRKAVKQVILQIKHQSKIRTEKTGHFLREIYDLDEKELNKAIKTIDRQGRKFFQKIIDMFLKGDTEMVTTMDAALAELVQTYKELKPKVPEGQENMNLEEVLKEVETLKSENEKLKNSLEISTATIESMIGEFGNMFGGGSDHELADHEVVDKVAEKN